MKKLFVIFAALSVVYLNANEVMKPISPAMADSVTRFETKESGQTLTPISDQRESFGYAAYGTTVVIPSAGVGYRFVPSNFFAIDVSLTAPVVFTLVLYDIKAMALLYPFGKGLYLGAGVGFSPLGTATHQVAKKFFPTDSKDVGVAVFGRACVGYEWKTSKDRSMFVQVSGAFPPTFQMGVGF